MSLIQTFVDNTVLSAAQLMKLQTLALNGAGLFSYPNMAAAIAAEVPPTVQSVQTMGWSTPGDGGGAVYSVVIATAEPSLPGAPTPGQRVITGGRLYTRQETAWDVGHRCFFQSADGRYWELDEAGDPSLYQRGVFGVAVHQRRTQHVWPTAAQDALAALTDLSDYITCVRGTGNIRVPARQFWLSGTFTGNVGVGMVGDLVPLLAENNDDFATMACTFFCDALNPAIRLQSPPEVRNIAVVNDIKPLIVVKRWLTGIGNSTGTLTVRTDGPHNFVPNQTSVVIDGTTKYNGTYTVLTVSATAFTVAYSGPNTGPDASPGTVVGSTVKGVSTISTTSNYEPVGFEEMRQHADAFTGQGFKIDPADFSRIENLRFYNFDIGSEVRNAKALVINAVEGDGRTRGSTVADAGQGASIRRMVVKARVGFAGEDVPGVGIAAIGNDGTGKIKVTLTVPIFYDYTASSDKIRLTGVVASNGYAINANWKVTPINGDPYSVILDGSNYAAGVPFSIGPGTATVQPYAQKYRVGAIGLANNGTGGIRVTCGWPHLITNQRRLTLVETIGNPAAVLWCQEKEFRANVIGPRTFDLLNLDGSTVPWNADLSSVTAVCAYFFGSMREGTGHTWENLDASRVYDSWAWGFTKSHFVDTGMVNYFACGRGEEGTYRGPNSIGWHFNKGSNGIRVFGGEIANAGLPILMESKRQVHFIGTHIGGGNSGVSVRMEDGDLTLIGCTLETPNGVSRNVVSLGPNMAKFTVYGRTGITAIIPDAGAQDRLRRVTLIDGMGSAASGQTINSALVLRPPEEDYPAVLSLRTGDPDDVDAVGNLIVSGDRVTNPNMGLSLGANGGATSPFVVQVRRQGTLRAGDLVGRLDFYGRNASARLDSLVRASNVVTGTTRWPHGFQVGDAITLTDGTAAGTWTLASVPTPTSFTFAQVAANETIAVVGSAIRGVVNGDVYASMVASVVDPTLGAETGALDLRLSRAGSQQSMLRIDANGVQEPGTRRLLYATAPNATPVRLTFDGAAPTTANVHLLSAGTMAAFEADVIARGPTGADWARWDLRFVLTRPSNIPSMVMSGGDAAISPAQSGGSGAGWRLKVDKDSTLGGLDLTGTGEALKQTAWLGRVWQI